MLDGRNQRSMERSKVRIVFEDRYDRWGRPRRYRRPYGFFSFIFDICMIGITGGLWLIWIFIREMRRY